MELWVKMLINRDLLMRQTIERYSGKTYSRAKINLSYDAIYIAEQWLNDPRGFYKVKKKTPFWLRRSLRSYIRRRVSRKKHRQRILGIFPSLVWFMSTPFLIRWISYKIVRDYSWQSSWLSSTARIWLHGEWHYINNHSVFYKFSKWLTINNATNLITSDRTLWSHFAP